MFLFSNTIIQMRPEPEEDKHGVLGKLQHISFVSMLNFAFSMLLFT